MVDPPLFNEDDKRRRIVITLNMTKIVQHLWEAIRLENALTLNPMFDIEGPIRSTGDMLPWYSGKAWEHTKPSLSMEGLVPPMPKAGAYRDKSHSWL